MRIGDGPQHTQGVAAALRNLGQAVLHSLGRALVNAFNHRPMLGTARVPPQAASGVLGAVTSLLAHLKSSAAPADAALHGLPRMGTQSAPQHQAALPSSRAAAESVIERTRESPPRAWTTEVLRDATLVLEQHLEIGHKASVERALFSLPPGTLLLVPSDKSTPKDVPAHVQWRPCKPLRGIEELAAIAQAEGRPCAMWSGNRTAAMQPIGALEQRVHAYQASVDSVAAQPFLEECAAKLKIIQHELNHRTASDAFRSDLALLRPGTRLHEEEHPARSVRDLTGGERDASIVFPASRTTVGAVAVKLAERAKQESQAQAVSVQGRLLILDPQRFSHLDERHFTPSQLAIAALADYETRVQSKYFTDLIQLTSRATTLYVREPKHEAEDTGGLVPAQQLPRSLTDQKDTALFLAKKLRGSRGAPQAALFNERWMIADATRLGLTRLDDLDAVAAAILQEFRARIA